MGRVNYGSVVSIEDGGTAKGSFVNKYKTLVGK